GGRRMRYDGAGNLTYDAYTGKGARTYDAESRMTAAADEGGGTASYAYDADGRRVKRMVGGAGEVWQVYGPGGELLAEYAKDSPANQPRKEYGYRGGELLVTAEPASAGWGPPPEFYENPLNPNHPGETPIRARHITDLRAAIDSLRAHKNLPAYGWSPAPVKGDPVSTAPITEMRAALDGALGAPAGGYTPGLAKGQPILAAHIQELRKRVLDAWQSGAAGADIRWMVADQLGTPRMVVDRTGSLAGVTRHDYLPFGEELSAGVGGRTPTQGYGAADSVRQKFTGYERDDETKLDYAQARCYSNVQGRFTSPDPLLSSGKSANPQTWNRYAYTINNPLVFMDPSGLEPSYVWTTDGAGNYRSMTNEEWEAYVNDPESDLAWAPVPAGTVITRLGYVTGGPEYVDRNSPLVGYAVSLGEDGNFHMAFGVPRFSGAMDEFARYAPALEESMEYMLAADMTIISGFSTIGSVGGATLGLETGGEAAAATASEAATFFEGTQYTNKVLGQMKLGDYHAFPKSVEAFADAGKVRTITGGDGQLYKVLEIPGGYKKADGVFQFIKNAQGIINHRLFVPGP
ncbi:MAG: RHS repeat-associated core domain-containing protein, partial [Acidobacteriota bacterium]|nr:RHS repeat-associated core domain-containing protein [Acidobacteriota bacterium]